MSLIRYNDPTPVRSFNRFVEDFFNRGIGEFVGSDNFISHPSVNVKETDDNYIIELAAPGLEKKDFNINVENDYLTISAERKQENETKEENYTRREFNYSSFRRSFNLPKSVNADAIAANYTDGVLNITLPKREEAKKKATRVIDIQ